MHARRAMNAPRARARASRLHDTRGAVLVAGIFMAALLAGSLFFLAGIGRALVQREGLQDGADAVAFTAAVYHARGMNLVALLNVLPAGLILVLIGVKVIHGIGYVVRVAHCTYGGEACEPARAMENAAIALEQRVFPAVHDMLDNLYASQNALAVGMPWVAVARSAKMAPAAGGPSFGVAVGPSLAGRRTTFQDPFVAESVVAEPPDSIREVGTWPGLPLADETGITDAATEWAVACEKNLGLLDTLVRGVIARYGVPVTPSTEFVLGSLASGGLCGEGVNQGIFTAVDIDKERHLAQHVYRAPKKVAAGAKLGADAFALWSVVGGHAEAVAGADRGVAVAGHGMRVAAPPAIGDVQVAKAEYYFEPPSADGSWAAIDPIAMWTLRWRARLRRVRPPSADVREAVAHATALDLAAFATRRQAPTTRDGADAALGRAEALRLLDAWFAAGAAGTSPESMNLWLGAQPGVVRPSDLVIVH